MSIGGASRDALIAASERAFAEMERIERLFTDWHSGSAVWELNERAGGAPVPVPEEVIELLAESVAVSRETGGAFDVTYRTVGRFWSFTEGSERVATDDEIAAALPHVGFEKIHIDRAAGTVALADRETQIGLGGVAKGYAVDRAVQVLESLGVTDGVVDAGGDMRVFRTSASSAAPARIGIRHPDRADSTLATIQVCNASIHTSGDYEHEFERDGVRYHHILDPRSGRPARGMRAVTLVVAADGTRGDALTKGLFVMGAERAIEWVDAHPETAALVMAPDGTIFTSRRWNALTRPPAPADGGGGEIVGISGCAG